MNLKKKLKEKMNKKGVLDNVPLVAIILGFFGVGFIGAVYVIILAALSEAQTNNPQGVNGTLSPGQEVAVGVVNNTLDLFSNFTGQFGTIGTVGGVLMLLVLVGAAGIGGYMLYQKVRQ